MTVLPGTLSAARCVRVSQTEFDASHRGAECTCTLMQAWTWFYELWKAVPSELTNPWRTIRRGEHRKQDKARVEHTWGHVERLTVPGSRLRSQEGESASRTNMN
uniref:Transposase n=1 Tax=Steinernema glaseri TaxID=37863 RepID=A0A1I7Z6I1_9BILA